MPPHLPLTQACHLSDSSPCLCLCLCSCLSCLAPLLVEALQSAGQMSEGGEQSHPLQRVRQGVASHTYQALSGILEEAQEVRE
jgi:hypothetical protein